MVGGSAAAAISVLAGPAASDGDAYLHANLLFFAGSLLYVLLDFAPPLGSQLDDSLLVALAALFIGDAVLYRLTWRGSGVLPAEGAPDAVDLAADQLNIGASSVYAVATVLNLASSPSDLQTLTVIYVMQAVSSGLCFVDALLYALSWWRRREAGAGLHVAVLSSDSLFFWSHVFSVLPALLYATCSFASLHLYFNAEEGRGGDNRNIRGRLIAGAEPLEIEYASIAGDVLYLVCSVLTAAAWSREIEDEEQGEEQDLAAKADEARREDEVYLALFKPVR